MNHILTNFEYLLALNSILVAITLLAFRIETHGRFLGAFPYATFFTVYTLVFYGLVPLGIDSWRFDNGSVYKVDHPFPNLISTKTYFLVVGYTLFHVIGYFVTIKNLKLGKANGIKLETIKNSKIISLSLFALIIIFFSFVLEYSSGLGIPGSGQLIQPFWRCGIAILIWLLIWRKLNRTIVFVFFVAIIAKLHLYLDSGLMTQALMDVMICIVILLYHRMFLWAFLSVIFCLVILSGYQHLKCFHANTSDQLPPHDLAASACITPNKLETSAKSLARRSTHLHLLQHVIQSTWEVQFESPTQPLIRAVLNHIPRAIWNNKPLENQGAKFGKKYRIISETDNRTSWNVPWISDFYMAGGYAVVLIYGLGTGILIGIGINWLSGQRDKIFGFGLYTATIFPLFYQESNFSLMTGSMLWILTFLLIISSLTNYIVEKNMKH